MMAMAACSSIDCSLNSKVLCNVQLQDSNGDSVVLAYPLTVALVYPNGDTVHYVNQKSDVSSFDIPLSYLGEEDMMLLELSITDTITVTTDTGTVKTAYTYSLSDKIRISKSNEPWFESVDCNAHYNHTIFSADADTHNFIDHIVINDAFVTNDPKKKNLFIRIRD
jgi:hypothetical protein